MAIKVTLTNPEEVSKFLVRAGKFASTCKTSPNDSLSDGVYKRIGLHCLESEHYSALYHLQAEFLVEGVSRVCTHQLVRHSLGVNFCQESAVFNKFHLYSDRFTCPESIKKAGLEARFYNICRETRKLYEDALKSKVSSSDARYILPQALNGDISVGINIPELIHISHLRLCTRAQWEIREVVQKMVNEIVRILPELKDVFVPKCKYLHGCNEKESCGLYDAYTSANKVVTEIQDVNVNKNHIESRLRVRVCSKCGNMLLTLDSEDDAQIGYEEGEEFLCRPCRRKENSYIFLPCNKEEKNE